MLRFVYFWSDVTVRTATLLLRFYARADLVLGALSLVVGPSFFASFRLIPWWGVLVGLTLFVVYAVALAVYDKATKIEDEKAELEKKLAYGRKRKAVNDLLGNALEEGLSLKQDRTYDHEDEEQDQEDDELLDEHLARYEEIRAWVDHTCYLIHNAFGKAEAQRFVSNEGFSEEELFERKLPRFMYRTPTQRKYSISARLKRLDTIIDRANVLEISPDFDLDEWTNG